MDKFEVGQKVTVLDQRSPIASTTIKRVLATQYETEDGRKWSRLRRRLLGCKTANLYIRAHNVSDDASIEAELARRQSEIDLAAKIEICMGTRRLSEWRFRKGIAALSPADLAEYVRLSKLVYEHGEGAK